MVARSRWVGLAVGSLAVATAVGAAGSAGATTVPDDAAGGSALVPEETGPADDSLDPVKIGFVNMNEGTPSFPGPLASAEAAVAYINASLGGIDGHPVELVTCSPGLDPDSNQQCAQQMVNDDSIHVATTQFVVGSDAFWPVLDQSDLTVLQGTPLSPTDFTAASAISYTPGAPGIIVGLAAYAVNELGATSIAAVAADNSGGQATVGLLQASPQMEGIEVSHIVVGETETDVAGALQAADADAYLLITPSPQCIQVANALDQIQSESTVLAVSSCADGSVISEVGGLVDGWYIGGPGPLPGLDRAADPELDRYLTVMEAAGLAAEAELTSAPQTFGQFMTLWSIGNSVGFDGLDRAGWTEALGAYTGPVFLGPRTLSCPGAVFPALCTTEARILVVAGEGTFTDPVPGPYDPYATS